MKGRWSRVAAAGCAVAVGAVVAGVVLVGNDSPPGGSPTGTSSSLCTEADPCLDQPGTGTGLPGDDQPGTSGTPGADSPLVDVELLVTSSGWDPTQSVVWVAGDVPVVESDGTCTVTLKQGTDQVEESVPAEPGPRTTTCAVEVDGARLSSGDWLVTLSYLSGHHSGMGQEVSINVP
ncbi:MAG: hypothetical protein LBU50_00015 [Cellulomonas sp.]|jgi:hypothetical protein|nr:hypothetical protein [Cellulomonas sp.]